MERLPEGSRRISGRCLEGNNWRIQDEVRFHRADAGQLSSSFTVREAIKGVDRNRCVKPAAFYQQRREFRNAWVSDAAGSVLLWFTLVEIRVRADRERTRWTDTYSSTYTRTETCRYVVTTECVPSREDHPYRPKPNKSPEIIHTQKPIRAPHTSPKWVALGGSFPY